MDYSRFTLNYAYNAYRAWKEGRITNEEITDTISNTGHNLSLTEREVIATVREMITH